MAILICIGFLSVFVQSLARDVRQQSALNIVDIIAAHSANLDAWVSAQAATLDPLVSAGDVITLNAAQHASLRGAATTTPFMTAAPRDWQFQYLVARPSGDGDLFGLLIVQPQTPHTQVISEVAQPFLSERIGAAQLGAGSDQTLDARTLAGAAVAGGLSGDDIALYSYMLNGVNPDLVRRRAYAGLGPSTLAAPIDLTANAITNAAAVGADQGQATSITAPLGLDVTTSSLTLPTGTITSLSMNGSAQATGMALRDVTTSALTVQGTTATQGLNATGKTNIGTATISGTARPANLYANASVEAQNITATTAFGDVLSADVSAEFEQTTAERLTLETLSTSTLTVTGGCTGC